MSCGWPGRASRWSSRPEALERHARGTRARRARGRAWSRCVYGVTTGVGARKKVRVSAEEIAGVQRAPHPEPPHRPGAATLQRRSCAQRCCAMANALAKGTSRRPPRDRRARRRALNGGETPRVRHARLGRARRPRSDGGPRARNLRRLRARCRRGLALVNSNAFSTGLAALAVADAERLARARSTWRAPSTSRRSPPISPSSIPLSATSGRTRGSRSHSSASRVSSKGSCLWGPGAARNLQDPLTLPLPAADARRDARRARRSPSASWQRAQRLAGEPARHPRGGSDRLGRELRDRCRSPPRSTSSAMALAPALTSANERLLKLLQGPLTGLPDGLAPAGLAEDWLGELGVAAQALTAEARLLAQPVSFEVVNRPQAEGIEDRIDPRAACSPPPRPRWFSSGSESPRSSSSSPPRRSSSATPRCSARAHSAPTISSRARALHGRRRRAAGRPRARAGARRGGRFRCLTRTRGMAEPDFSSGSSRGTSSARRATSSSSSGAGYIQAGAFVPEAVLDHPEKVTELHREFVHAGSDVVEAFTYYAHREKMRVIGKEHLLEEMNRHALAIAKEVADETGTLFAGDICNTNVFDPDDAESRKAVQAMFDEQVALGRRGGRRLRHRRDLLLRRGGAHGAGEIKAAGLPAVVTCASTRSRMTRDGMTPADGCAMLEEAGADVVGLNCIRGLQTTLALLPSIRERSGATSPRCRCRTARRAESRPSSRCAIRAHRIPGGMPSPPRSSPSSRPLRGGRVRAGGRCARHPVSRPLLRQRVVPDARARRGARAHARRPAATRRTCPSTRTSAPTRS